MIVTIGSLYVLAVVYLSPYLFLKNLSQFMFVFLPYLLVLPIIGLFIVAIARSPKSPLSFSIRLLKSRGTDKLYGAGLWRSQSAQASILMVALLEKWSVSVTFEKIMRRLPHGLKGPPPVPLTQYLEPGFKRAGSRLHQVHPQGMRTTVTLRGAT